MAVERGGRGRDCSSVADKGVPEAAEHHQHLWAAALPHLRRIAGAAAEANPVGWQRSRTWPAQPSLPPSPRLMPPMPAAELKESFLEAFLDFPPWLTLKKASCSTVRARVSWTKLKTVPVRLVGLGVVAVARQSSATNTHSLPLPDDRQHAGGADCQH